MKALKLLFRFYINSSIHVAFAVVSLTVLTYTQSKLPMSYGLLIFVFLSTITGYNFVKYAPVAKLHHRSLTPQLKQIQIFSFIMLLGLIICMFFVNFKIVLICLFLGILTLLYAVPIGKKNLREIYLLKVFIIAFIWAVTTYLLPFINNSFDWEGWVKNINFQFYERIIWVIMLMIPFEIRDLKFDRKRLKTLISIFGVRTVKFCSIIIMFLLLIHEIYFQAHYLPWLYIVIYFSLILAILMANTNQKAFYSSFYVESLPVLWMISSFILL